LPVVVIEEDIEAIRATMPELPEKRERFMQQYALPKYDASVLTAEASNANYYETVVKTSGGDAEDLRQLGDRRSGFGLLNKQEPGDRGVAGVGCRATGRHGARITDKTISGKIAKMVFEAMANGEGSADEIIEKRGLKQVTDSGAIESILDDMLAANAEQVEQYRAADEAKRGKMFGFFVGQAMKASKGKANPAQVNELLKRKLEG
jgi:aspartyl-tRNA(Asn)/glutamyl-tRNA(Gln) amidotransferase subunit B